MHEISVNPFQKRALAIATAIAVIFGAYFLGGYFLLIVFATVVAFLFNPLYQKLLKKWGKPGLAVSLTLLATIFTLIVPLTVVLAITVNEVAILIDKLAGVDLDEVELSLIETVNRTFVQFNINYSIDEAWIKDNVAKVVSTYGSVVIDGLTAFLGNFFSLFSTSIIYIFVFMALLIKQNKILEVIRALNPLGDNISNLYQSRVSAMIQGSVRGQFTIAIAQGFTDAALLYFAGLTDLFFFFFVLLTALSVIPLGGGIVAIPIGIIMILTGNIWGGLLVIGGHLLIVTNIDNVLRPKLIPKQARLDSALMLLSVFSGIKFFGFLGIVIGPVIMILIVTTIQVYLEVYKNIESVDRSIEQPKQNKTLANRLRIRKKNNQTPQN